MNTSKRSQRTPLGKGSGEALFSKSAPAVPVPSPAEERQAWRRRQALLAAGVAALLVLVVLGAFMLWPRPTASVTPSAPGAPQVPVAVVPAPPQAAAPVGGSGIACEAIAGLPVIEGATCIGQKRDQ